jgi:hypothetical protein
MATTSEQGDRTNDAARSVLSSTSAGSAGDPLPPNCELIEVHVSELKQLFNAIDPSPFRERDLDPNAEEFITDWAKEASPSATFGLAVYLDRPAGLPNEPNELREAIHEFFRHRARLSRHRLRELFRRGRTSLVIGICALGVSVAAGNLVVNFFSNHLAEILKGRLFDRRVGRHVEAHGNLPLRLVADPCGSCARRQTERHACADLVQAGWQRRGVAVGLAGRRVRGSSGHSEPIESPKADRG